MQAYQPTIQTRRQKKQAKMAAKKLAKETGIPIPKKPRNVKPRKKAEQKLVKIEKPKVSSYVQSVVRTHIELQKQMEYERTREIEDFRNPQKPAYLLEFFVSNNAKNLGTTLEFPDERVTFLDPKKTCSEFCKMLAGIGLKAILAKIETRVDETWSDGSLRLIVHDKDQSPPLRYFEKEQSPNFMENGSVRTTEALLILDLIAEGTKTRLYITNIDGERISIGSYLLDETMMEFSPEEARICFNKSIAYTMRCALRDSIEGKLFKLANEYFGGNITAMFLPTTIVG